MSVKKGGETKKGGGAARISVDVVVPDGGPQTHSSNNRCACRRGAAGASESIGGVASVVRTMVAHADVETEAWPVQQGRRRNGGRSERGGDAADGKGRGRERLGVVRRWSSRDDDGEKVGRGKVWQACLVRVLAPVARVPT